MPEGTKVTLKLVYEPEGATEMIGDALGFLTRRVKGDLERFKEFMEDRERATGAWRGEIHGQSGPQAVKAKITHFHAEGAAESVTPSSTRGRSGR